MEMEMDDVFSDVRVEGEVVDMVNDVCRLYLGRLRELLLEEEVGVKDLVSLGKVLLPLLEGVVGGGGVSSSHRGIDLLKVVNGGGFDG
jgi:hypothetical protein